MVSSEQRRQHGLAMSQRIVVLTGAGISADSGVRTFRDSGGLWDGLRPQDVATPEAWARDRQLVWKFYQERRAQLQTVEPNGAHRALADFARWCSTHGVGFELITQNVDDLHERAGSEAVHMHGEISVLRCEACGIRVRDSDHVELSDFVACAKCDHPFLRPDVVWFGEVPVHLDRIETVMTNCTHFIAIGTSGEVWPAAGLLLQARELGAKTWVQALEPPSNLAGTDRFLPGRAAEVVPVLLAELQAGLRPASS